MHSLPHHTSQPPSMEDQNQCKTSDQQLQNLNLPKVLLHGPPGFSSVLQPPYSEKFHLLNHSSLPLHQFAATHPHHCATVAAVLCDGGYPLTVDMLSLLPSLRLVVTASAGTDHVDLDECRRRGIQVAGAGNLFSEDVADLAVALLIDVVMKISAADRSLRKRHVDSRAITYASKVTGKRVGIVGLGRIGLEVAHRLEALNCKVSYNSRKQKPFVPYPFYSNVVDLATNTNVLVLCCALNDQTRHIINREVMVALGKGGVIVNVGRGALIHEKELLKCLMEGEIEGAGLDVFENEPLVDEHFFSLDNVVLSPHAGFSTLESYVAICQLLGRNLEAFFSDNPLITPVI
ncbi:glyoxylate/hydroxypyruvate reductase HPR3-like [Vigna unguiculata]|nr:glyoxylate/hydroxypyruvate reductase HPR3-like [Vigna unguiculata]